MSGRESPGFWVRLASAWVDALGFSLGSAALLLLLLQFGASLSTDALLQLSLFLWLPASLAASLAGLAFLNAGGRRSPGKILFGLAVVDREMQPVSLPRSLLRTTVNSLLLGLSFLLVPFARGRGGLHDLVAGTRVVRLRPPMRGERLIALAAVAISVWIKVAVSEELTRHFESFHLPSRSMEPALLRGDHITTVTRWARAIEPRRGDVVVFEHPKKPGLKVVKRIMALPGERVSLRDTVLYIDGAPLRGDPGVYRGPRPPIEIREPLQIPAGHYYLLGDNRNNSADSRLYGPVPHTSLHAKAGIVYLSIADGLSVRWDRFGRLVR